MNALLDEPRRIVREAPGAAAARGVLHILRTLADDGNQDAALALGWIVCDELALSADESVSELPALGKLLVLGYAPTRFVAGPADVAELARAIDRPAAYARFRELVRRAAPVQDVVLTALVLAEFATSVEFQDSVLGGGMSDSARQRVLRQISGATRIVPGDGVDSSFSVGRDFVLGVASYDGFSFTVQHELGHHLTNHIRYGERETLDAEQVHAITGAVRQVLVAADGHVGQPVRPGDPRVIRLPSGLQIMCTAEAAYTHFSLSQVGGPIAQRYAIGCVHLIAELLGAGPDTVVVAYSPAGLCHLAVPGVPRPRREPDVAGLAERAEAWFAALTRAGRVARDEQDLVGRMLGDADPRMEIYPSSREAMPDLRICARLRDGQHVDEDQVTRLRAAVACADPEAVRLVLADGAAVGPVGLARLGESRCVVVTDTVEHAGSSADDLRQVLAELHDAGFDVDEPVTESGGTLLFDAAVRDAELTGFLLATGADVHRRDHNGTTALAEAARCGNWRAVTVLFEAGARPDDRDHDGRSALHHAVGSGSTETVARLIAAGATVAATDTRGATPLAHATTATMVTLLCRTGANPNAADAAGGTPLMAAANRGNADAVGALLRQGADPHAVTDTGEVALHFAATAPDHRVAVLTALLDAGADPDEETDEGMTALMFAAWRVHDDAVALLLERGADADARTVRGQTALMQASDGRTEWTRDFGHNDGMMACMRLLVAAGADVDAADDHGWTALHYACRGFDAGPVAQLLRLGASPNVTTDDGTTPLGQARASGHERMVEDLVTAGAREEVA